MLSLWLWKTVFFGKSRDQIYTKNVGWDVGEATLSKMFCLSCQSKSVLEGLNLGAQCTGQQTGSHRSCFEEQY